MSAHVSGSVISETTERITITFGASCYTTESMVNMLYEYSRTNTQAYSQYRYLLNSSTPSHEGRYIYWYCKRTLTSTDGVSSFMRTSLHD